MRKVGTYCISPGNRATNQLFLTFKSLKKNNRIALVQSADYTNLHAALG